MSRLKAVNKPRRWLEKFLLLAGVIGLGIWAWSLASHTAFESWEDWVFDREIRGEPATVKEYVAEKGETIVQEVRAWLGIPAPPKRSISSPLTPPSVNRSPLIGADGLVGRLVIPRLQLSSIVREGADGRTLRLTLGHIRGTALPGQSGNVGVAGHRDSLFRGLRNIEKNDMIRFETLAGNYSYQVEDTRIVSPRDVSVLRMTNYPELTLVTCYPFYYIGSAPQRFIVKARQVSASATALQTGTGETGQTASHPVDLRRRAGAGANPAKRTVAFEVSTSHSRQLSAGISLGVTLTDVSRQSVSGWMWVMPDRRTIWIRNQNAHDPVIFYGSLDGKRRELLITEVKRNSVKGYLLLPGIEKGMAQGLD